MHSIARFAHRCLLAIVGTLFCGAALSAQQTTGVPQISESKLPVIAAAYLRVARLQEDYQAKMAAAHEPQAKIDLRHQQDAEYQQIMTAEKITSEEYRDALNVLAADGDQRAKFDKVVETLRTQEPAPKAGG